MKISSRYLQKWELNLFVNKRYQWLGAGLLQWAGPDHARFWGSSTDESSASISQAKNSDDVEERVQS